MTGAPAARPRPAPFAGHTVGTMLTGTTPSTHDGRRNDLAPPGVDGGELTVMSSGAEPLRCDAESSPSSRDLPAVRPSLLRDFLLPPRLRLRCRCNQLPRDDFELSLAPPAAKSGSLVHLSYCDATQKTKKNEFTYSEHFNEL